MCTLRDRQRYPVVSWNTSSFSRSPPQNRSYRPQVPPDSDGIAQQYHRQSPQNCKGDRRNTE